MVADSAPVYQTPYRYNPQGAHPPGQQTPHTPQQQAYYAQAGSGGYPFPAQTYPQQRAASSAMAQQPHTPVNGRLYASTSVPTNLAAAARAGGGTPTGLNTPTSINGVSPAGVGFRRDPSSEQQMRQAIRELAASIDPYATLDVEAETALLAVADEFLDSVTNFSARLARHRGSDVLDVKDLQLHLERQHQIRIPGFLPSDEAPKPPAFLNVPPPHAISALASTNATPANAATSGKGKEKEKGDKDKDKDKGGEKEAGKGTRAKRLAAVKQATK